MPKKLESAGESGVSLPERKVPVAIQRLLDEVRLEQSTGIAMYDRWHGRHNRSLPAKAGRAQAEPVEPEE